MPLAPNIHILKEDRMRAILKFSILTIPLIAGLVTASPIRDIKTPNLELGRGGKPRDPVMVPPDVTNNLALGCEVTASAKPLSIDKTNHDVPLGELDCITDGLKEHDDDRVTLPSGKQWVQIDLGKTQEVWAVHLWYWTDYMCVYHDVVVQISNDPDFTNNVTTVFNNDHDNSAGLGAGKDKEYFVTNEGRGIAVDGVQARYLRVYSNESTESFNNRYTEIEVYGRPPTNRPSSEATNRVPLKIMLPKPIFM
jgi:hypothetical protein